MPAVQLVDEVDGLVEVRILALMDQPVERGAD